MPQPSFRNELVKLLNHHAREYNRRDSHTPDYVLADFICGCLSAFDNATMPSHARSSLVIVLPTVNELDRRTQ